MNFPYNLDSVAVERSSAGSTLQVEMSMRSQTDAILPSANQLMALIMESRCMPENESDVEMAIREALANAVLHGNLQDPRKEVRISCRVQPGRGISIVVSDEGKGFDPTKVPDPTEIENILSLSGRGIHLMKGLMDEVHFERGGTEVHMHKGVRGNRAGLFDWTPGEWCSWPRTERLYSFEF
jgi:serine/threonine-protein kinase RsbW